jgi:hypothetical protein
MACCSRAHSAFWANVTSALKATIEAVSAANAPTDARILLRPNARRIRVFAAFISSIVSARFAIHDAPPASLGERR